MKLLVVLAVAARASQLLGDLSLLRLCTGRMMPPIGTVYTHTLSLPLLGHQGLEISIINGTTAMLMMQGALNLNEPVLYRADEGKISFTLTDSTVRLQRRVHTSLGDAEYDGNSDTLIVTVSPPVVPSVRIRLHRIDQEDETVDTFSDAHMALDLALQAAF